MASIEIRSTNLNNIIVGKLHAKYNAAGDRILRYYIDIGHSVMHQHKELSAPDVAMLQKKTDTLVAYWDKKWAEHQKKQDIAAGHEVAAEASAKAERRLEGISRLLRDTVGVDDAVNWDSLKETSQFPSPDPFSEPEPVFESSREPALVLPTISFFDRLLGRRKEKLRAAEAAYADSINAWKMAEENRRHEHHKAHELWRARKAAYDKNREREAAEFYQAQIAANERIDALREAWLRGDPEAVLEHASMVLEASDYDDLFDKSFELDFRTGDKLLMVDYELPSPDIMPTLKSVRFIKATGELRETHISERERKNNYDSTCYQVSLRTIHEIFEADVNHHIQQILFNGYATHIDRSTGQDVRSIIMSLLAEREEFTQIDLGRVDPKACFKKLKGVSAAVLSSLSPIAPIMEMDRQDRRFIEGRAALGEIDEATNLAAMGWEDFEHLIREVFEREFSGRGGEVRVTHASGDGGVDAVAFDPDPISGGKVVIQAKRYTRTVGVAAVRDLYGTTLNEGATKGILVTTSDYGPDAYRFASDKPIFLMTGSNLLHLLQKHGVKAKIDLRQAREALAEVRK